MIHSKFWFYDAVERTKYHSLHESIMNNLEYHLYKRIKECDKKRSKHKK